MFITPAFAQGTAQAVSSNTDMLMQFLPFVFIILIFYFLLIRPQSLKQKQQLAMLDNLKKGDEVVTESGHIATVHRVVDAHEVVLEIAPSVHVRTVRSKIAALYTPPDATPPKGGMPKSKTKAS